MPDGVPEPEASVDGNANEHCSNLKRKAEGISRTLSEVFAYLVWFLDTMISTDDEGPCMGIEVNIWERAKVNSFQHIRIMLIMRVSNVLFLILFLMFYVDTTSYCAHIGGRRRPARWL